MRGSMEQMQGEVNEFMQYVKREMVKGLGDWEQRLNTALVKSAPGGLVLRRRAPVHVAAAGRTGRRAADRRPQDRPRPLTGRRLRRPARQRAAPARATSSDSRRR